MFHAVRCPVCKGVLFERDGIGACERIICRCKRLLQIEADGETVSVLSEDYVAKQWQRRDAAQPVPATTAGVPAG